MPSPLPGMNPYLEQEDVWHDFHERVIPEMAGAISVQVMPAYITKVDLHIFIRELPAEDRRLVGRGDFMVADTGSGRRPSQSASAVAVAPVYGRVASAVDIERQAFIEVRDRESRELITVVELLSPANKKNGPDREQYLSKRRQLLAASVNLVEIDLLRGLPRLPIEGLPQCDYYVMVSRADERPEVKIWPFLLRDPIPVVPIPLRPSDSDVTLNIQQALHEVYRVAGYGLYMYSGRPQPALTPEQAKWAAEFIPQGT